MSEQTPPSWYIATNVLMGSVGCFWKYHKPPAAFQRYFDTHCIDVHAKMKVAHLAHPVVLYYNLFVVAIFNNFYKVLSSFCWKYPVNRGFKTNLINTHLKKLVKQVVQTMTHNYYNWVHKKFRYLRNNLVKIYNLLKLFKRTTLLKVLVFLLPENILWDREDIVRVLDFGLVSQCYGSNWKEIHEAAPIPFLPSWYADTTLFQKNSVVLRNTK